MSRSRSRTDGTAVAPRRSPARVDPRAPRFGQAITAVGLSVGIALGEPHLVYAIAAVLVLAVTTGWRVNLYGSLWRTVAVPIVGEPAEREAAEPHRFAQFLGAVGTSLASLLLLASPAVDVDLAIAGYGIAGLVALLAALAATTGFCLGCRMYRQVQFFRRLGVV